MIRLLFLFFALAQGATAQRIVDPDDLTLIITIESTGTTPFQHEMVLLTIHGIYRRHITLEKLEMPDLEGTNWMQLGQDHWFESTVDGLKVKNMRRRMALFPEEVGRLTIAPFIHHLTLLDENDNWFEHNIQSEPITLDVQAAPIGEDWWFPVRSLEISDTWSNPPDQLGAGDGVLRIITLKAVGVGPDMMPPMPELKSPSAHIFAHPEKKLVELSPKGPESITFWRWTIKPKNPPSAILEPIEFSYFNTTVRQMRTATISAQRVAISPEQLPMPVQDTIRPSVTLNPAKTWLTALAAFLAGLLIYLGRSRQMSFERLRSGIENRILKFQLKRACWTGDTRKLRRIARALANTTGPSATRTSLLNDLDGFIFGKEGAEFDFKTFYRQFQATF